VRRRSTAPSLPSSVRIQLLDRSAGPQAAPRTRVLYSDLLPCPFASSHFGGLFPSVASSATHDLPARGSGGMELKPGLSALVTGGASGIGEQEQCRLRSRAASIPLLPWCSWARPQSATGSVAWPVETLSARSSLWVSPCLDKTLCFAIGCAAAAPEMRVS
jgi:hypothetical protein